MLPRGIRATVNAYLLVDRLGDTTSLDAGADEPVYHRIDRCLRRSKEINDFLRAHVFPVIRGLGVRARTLDQFLNPV